MKELVAQFSADDLRILWAAMAAMVHGAKPAVPLTTEQWERAEELFEMLDEVEQERCKQ